MRTVNSQSPPELLAALPPDRRADLEVVRKAILDNLHEGYQEIVDFGMRAYVILLETYPKTYNGHSLMYGALASQNRRMAMYLMNI